MLLRGKSCSVYINYPSSSILKVRFACEGNKCGAYDFLLNNAEFHACHAFIHCFDEGLKNQSKQHHSHMKLELTVYGDSTLTVITVMKAQLTGDNFCSIKGSSTPRHRSLVLDAKIQ